MFGSVVLSGILKSGSTINRFLFLDFTYKSAQKARSHKDAVENGMKFLVEVQYNQVLHVTKNWPDYIDRKLISNNYYAKPVCLFWNRVLCCHWLMIVHMNFYFK